MSDNQKRDIFYGVVAIATLIVAIIGATLAYFSISVNSAENVVNATAKTVQINYIDGQTVVAQAEELIPATLQVVKQAYENHKGSIEDQDMEGNVCRDDNNEEVCSIYRFSVSSNSEYAVSATLNNESNGFNYLSYAVYDVNNNTWLKLDDENNEFLNIKACDNEADNEINDCTTVSGETKTYNFKNSLFGVTLDGDTTSFKTMTIGTTAQVYDIVLFINENNQPQNEDQGKQYLGTIYVSVLDEEKITGYINQSP